MLNGGGALRGLQAARGMRIAHVAMEFKGITPSRYKLGDVVRDLSIYQAKHGANVRVYLPRSRNVEENYSLISKEKVRVYSYGEDKETEIGVSGVELPDQEDTSGRLSVFLVEDSKLFGDYDLYDYPNNVISPWVVLPQAVIAHLKNNRFTPEIIHCHEWQTGLLPAYLKFGLPISFESPVIDARTVFTPHDFRQMGIFSRGEWRKTGLPESLFSPESLEYFNNICLLKAGLHAHLVLFVRDDQLEELISSGKPEGLGKFIIAAKPGTRVFSLLPRGARVDQIPDDYNMSVIEAYRESLHGGNYSIDLSQTLLPEVEAGNFQIGGVFRNIKSWRTNRAIPLLAHENKTSASIVYLNAGLKGIMEEKPGTRSASGSAVIGLMSDTLEKMKDNGRYVLSLDSGSNSGAWGVGLSDARLKGLRKALGAVVKEKAMDQTSSVFAQLPNQGKGWNLVLAPDNVWAAQRIMVGKRPLSEAKHGIILFGRPEDINMDVNSSEMRKLENYGIMTIDENTSELKYFIEKPKAETIADMAERSNSSYCLRRAFMMAIKKETAELMVRLYRQPGKAKKRPLLECGLDWSRHIIEPMYMSREEWMKSPKDGGRGWGANKIKDRKVSIKDWEALWEIAQEIKKASGGVGVGNIGKESFLADISDPGQLHNLNYLATSSNTVENQMARNLFGIPLDRDVINSALEGVELPEKARSYLIKDAVFKKGGKVGKNCVVIGSIFEEYIEIPDQTVIIGSHIYSVDNKLSLVQRGGLVYNLDARGATFRFSARTAQMSIYLESGLKLNGRHTIDVASAGGDFGTQKVFGVRSLDEIRDIVSLERTLGEQEKLKKMIQELLNTRIK